MLRSLNYGFHFLLNFLRLWMIYFFILFRKLLYLVLALRLKKVALKWFRKSLYHVVIKLLFKQIVDVLYLILSEMLKCHCASLVLNRALSPRIMSFHFVLICKYHLFLSNTVWYRLSIHLGVIGIRMLILVLITLADVPFE